MIGITIFILLIGPILIFMILLYCAQKWAYKCCLELRKLNITMKNLLEKKDKV